MSMLQVSLSLTWDSSKAQGETPRFPKHPKQVS
ncbi:hypothetical protein VIMY103929_07365 [Vibrio mytili]|jgi:hypothetical protein